MGKGKKKITRVKSACHPAGLNDQRWGEVKEECIEQLGRTGDWGRGAAQRPPHTYLLGRSWMSLKESRKMKKDNLFPFPIQEIAEGIYISWGDLEYKL